MGLPAFPDAIPVEEYVRRAYKSVEPYGLTLGSTLAMVGFCRDELTDRVAEHVRGHWGPPFHMAAMAGMLFLGETGLRAAQMHAPGTDGRQRYVMFAMPHLGIDEDGTVGRYRRPGQAEPSAACGALMSFRAELATGDVKVDLDPNDLEQSLLRQRLLRSIPYGAVPDPVHLTHIARDAILADLVETTTRMRTWGRTDVGVFSGIHIHTPDGDYVAPGRSFVYVGQERAEHELTL